MDKANVALDYTANAPWRSFQILSVGLELGSEELDWADHMGERLVMLPFWDVRVQSIK